MPKYPARIGRVFQALSDPTRRAVLERLSKGPASTSELVAPFDMAMPSFLQHMGVLSQSGLVRSRKRGRVRTWRMTPAPLRGAENWMARQRRIWERRLDQLDNYLYELKESSK